MLIRPNTKNHYMRPGPVPEQFKALLIQKEDRFFFYHLGINPGSILRSFFGYVLTGRFAGSSTITQQLVKNLLNNENERTISNKIIESLYAFSLELHTSKNDILAMYANIAYFGKQTEGITEASHVYFNSDPEALTTTELLQLLVMLSHPADIPYTIKNNERVKNFAKHFQIPIDEDAIKEGKTNAEKDAYAYERKNENAFELSSLYQCYTACNLTIDNNLTTILREVLQKNLASPAFASVQNGAIIVLRADETKKTNEILALIGSPYPYSMQRGYQINMALRPRPIGSTWKLFIYAEAFRQGARPYTIIDDTEYKYEIGTGFAFYPKNYDGKYQGKVTLHYALANSLNVPAVRVLEYVGLENFAQFLTKDLEFRPQQPLEQYQLSIALGGLEMDLLSLANYFSIFPNNGVLKPLIIAENQYPELPMSTQPTAEKQIFDPAYTELVTKILSDRSTGVGQFGLKSNLNLSSPNYAVKTGTTYDYHDSWTIGYTPDFVVGVWLGNSDNTAMQQLSGSVGAGKIWHDVMTILLNGKYNTGREFSFDSIAEYSENGILEYGLTGDDYEFARDILKNNTLVVQPHHNDTLYFENGMTIPLVASEPVEWSVNNSVLGEGSSISWNPSAAGIYLITARGENQKIQKLKVDIVKEKNY